MWCGDRFFLLLLFSVIVNQSVGGDQLVCPPSSEATTASKLKDHLLCNYDEMLRPVSQHTDATAVSFKILMKYFTYDAITSTLSLDAWLTTFWKDQHLTWNPDEFDGIKLIHLTTTEIWVPDLSVYNRVDQSGDPSIISYTRCVVSSKGMIICVPSVHIDALCIPNLTNYPYDTQSCVVRFGSWVHKGEEIDLKLINPIVDTEDMNPNGEWEIIDHSATKHAGNYSCCPNATYPSIQVNFKIKRLSGGHVISVIIPSIVALILTFTSLGMSPINKDRIILCYVNLMTQFFHVQYISWMVPLKGDQLPLILVFARDSLLLSAILIIETLVVKYIMEKNTVAPVWTSSVASFGLRFPPGQLVLLRDNSQRGVASAKGEEDGVHIINNQQSNGFRSHDWEIFGRILDILFVISYALVYSIMFIKFEL